MLPSGHPNLWRISTIHRVEEFKSMIRLLPIWAMGIILTTSSSHNNSFAIQQARIMDRHLLNHFQFPAASISIFAVIAMLVGVTLYDRLLVPITRRFTKRPSGITYFMRMGIGLAINMLGNVSAALVERKRKNAMNLHSNSISVFWLVPQFAIHGISEAFYSVGHMEFCYDQAPESMRSSATALFWLSISLGNYLATALVTIVHNCTKKRVDWLQDDLNKAKLDSYYWLVVVFQIFNIGIYLLCVKYYIMKPLEAVEDEDTSKEIDRRSVVVEEAELAAASKSNFA
jgi:dipeptide/tripeptide permease